MQRREFHKLAGAAAAVAITGCGGGGGSDTVASAPVSEGLPTGSNPPAPGAAPAPAPAPGVPPPPGAAPAPAPTPAPAPPPPKGTAAIGTNLSGMQSAGQSLRFGPGQVPNVNFTVPRAADVAWLASNGYTKNRLPIQWEQLQPMLHDTPANAAAIAAIGAPGAFNPVYESYITGVLDAHAAVGMKCILDLHNFCRYLDFIFQPDGSVVGLTKPANPLLYAFTTDASQVRSRIFALAPGATLKQTNFTDFWTRAANKWKNHPGFGGYGLMNEPFFMPRPGELVEAFDGFGQDLTIWPAYARAGIAAIRAVDPVNPIYLGGNNWSGAFSLPFDNPGWPLAGTNLIYEIHLYMDAYHNGQSFDFDTEANKDFTAGRGTGGITLNTALERLQVAVTWAQQNGNLPLALTETAMPIDDPRWEEEFRRALVLARQVNCEIYSWAGGAHWTIHNSGVNHVAGWHENKTLEPSVSGQIKSAWGISQETLYDDGPGFAPGGGTVTITVYARGALASPVTLSVASNAGGTLSKSLLTIPAGANGQDSYTFTPAPNTISTLTYTSTAAGVPPPPPRKVYSLADPVGFAATSLPDAAMAIIAKYSACKWEVAQGYTDYLLGVPSAAGQQVRAISDSGYGSSPGNAMEMINWINDGPNMGGMVVPVMRVTNGFRNSDHTAPNTQGFWCRKSFPVAVTQPNPKNRVPYNLEDPHFAIVAASVPGLGNTGVLFEASNGEQQWCTELGFANSQPRAQWTNPAGVVTTLLSPARLAPNAPAVLTLTSQAGAQQLRVNSAVVAGGAATFPAAVYDQMLLGSGFRNFSPRDGFGGNLYSAITGKGAPTAAELAVLERYIKSTAGIP